jgi:uncharacterized membrane protein YeaQ/YmgE (transglycosylase-associated protein family)
MTGTPSKRLATKRVTVKQLNDQLDELRSQVNNLPLGIDKAQLLSELDVMLADVHMLGIREESADKANFPLLQQTIAREAAEQEQQFRAFAHDHALQLQAVEERINTRINGQSTEIETLKVTTNGHSTQIYVVEQGQQSLHRRVSVLEGIGFFPVFICLFIGALAGIIAATLWQSQPNTTAFGEIILGLGIGGFVAGFILIVVEAVRRPRSEKVQVTEAEEPEDAQLDIMQPRDAELQNVRT